MAQVDRHGGAYTLRSSTSRIQRFVQASTGAGMCLLRLLRISAHSQFRKEQVESLMCYLGVADTFTPCHKDLCASSGHNIMSYTENNGSSFWFMTKSSDASLVSSFFQDELQTELDWENRILTVEQFSKAQFTIFVAEQKLGDMVLVPPRSCHQVVNRGGLTIKTSWSRMTVRGLSMALYHELPIYRRFVHTSFLFI